MAASTLTGPQKDSLVSSIKIQAVRGFCKPCQIAPCFKAIFSDEEKYRLELLFHNSKTIALAAIILHYDPFTFKPPFWIEALLTYFKHINFVVFYGLLNEVTHYWNTYNSRLTPNNPYLGIEGESPKYVKKYFRLTQLMCLNAFEKSEPFKSSGDCWGDGWWGDSLLCDSLYTETQATIITMGHPNTLPEPIY